MRDQNPAFLCRSFQHLRIAHSVNIAAGRSMWCRGAVICHKGEWVQYSTPEEDGAEYVVICRPSFTLDTAHWDSFYTSRIAC